MCITCAKRKGNLLFTVNTADPCLLIPLYALQVYMPRSDDCAFRIVRELSTELPFTEADMLYLFV